MHQQLEGLFQAKSWVSVMYVDDILLLARGQEEGPHLLEEARELLRRLGIAVNEHKPMKNVAKEVLYLGYLVRLRERRLLVSKEKRREIRRLDARELNHEPHSAGAERQGRRVFSDNVPSVLWGWSTSCVVTRRSYCFASLESQTTYVPACLAAGGTSGPEWSGT